MIFPTIQWNFILVEILITLALTVLVVMDMFISKETRKDLMGGFSYFALLLIGGVWLSQRGLEGETFSGMFQIDSLSWFFKGIFLVSMFFVLVMTQQFFQAATQRRNHFYLLLWTALLGMCLISSCADFLLLFISIEIMTLSFYVMTAYLKSDKHSLEAGMKYLILGSLASGFFLYGLSYLYGVTHSTRFDMIQDYALNVPMGRMTLFALLLIFTTVGFKIAAAPFHLWVPDVYQGAPTPVTAFLSVGSKAAGFVVLLRLFMDVFVPWQEQWQMIFAILAAITMCYGNLAAMFQTNIKRLLGYSSIGHAGYLLMGAAAGTAMGASAINFYLVGYLFTNLAAFLVIVLFSLAVDSDEIQDYAGLIKRSGFLGGVLIIALVSLAGIPPLAGFFGKFTLLMATVDSGLFWLAMVAAVNIVISLYYYLKVVKRIYVDAPYTTSPIPVSASLRLILLFATLCIIGIGIFQGPFLDAAMTAAQSLPVR